MRLLLLVPLPFLLLGCHAGSPGVKVSVGAFGFEVAIQVGGGELSATTPPPKPTVTVKEDPAKPPAAWTPGSGPDSGTKPDPANPNPL